MDTTAEMSSLEIMSTGPVAPLRATYTARLNASVPEVFEYVTNKAHICEFVPGLLHIEVHLPCLGGGIGTQRVCDFGNDMVIQETIVLWQPPTRHAYRIAEPNPFGLYDHLGVVSTRPVGDDVELNWLHYYNHHDLPAIAGLLDETFGGVMENLIDRFGAIHM